MLYFITGREPNQQEFSWHVGSNLPRLAKVEQIYADGHELEYLQRLGFGIGNDGNVTFHGERANAVLRAMRLAASTHHPVAQLPVVKSTATVGKLRQQSALCDASRRVVLVSSDPQVSAFLATLEVSDIFPDTTNEFGSFDEPTFKIRVSKR